MDIRLMRQRLAGRALLFSRDVQYIFDSQIHEAEILVLNKSDLLGSEAAQQVLARARERYPAKEVLLQNSLSPADLARWLETLGVWNAPDAPDVPDAPRSAGAPHASIPVDYERYARGETALAWYDASLSIDATLGSAKEISRRLIDELRDSVRRRGRPVGHLKIHVRHEAGSFTTSITADDTAARGIEEAAGRHLDVTINARAEDTAAGLRAAIREGASRALSGDGISWKLLREDSFHPSPPRPFLRLP